MLILLHSEQPKLHIVLAILSAIGLRTFFISASYLNSATSKYSLLIRSMKDELQIILLESLTLSLFN